MATRVFSEEELDRLRRFPEISRDELIRFFTLTDADELFARPHRGLANVFGVAVQLCTLPWLGFVSDDPGPVDAAHRTAPVSGRAGAAADCAGPDPPRTRAAVPDPAHPARAVRSGRAGRDSDHRLRPGDLR
ncbi:transposase tn3 family protein [Amycolatopsis decaplanina DSM 44594]|uniref:Transposase tn3 family protein n=1 Tax=Amycolatopsis decaplanina DSM 44594 TaxID=1284240 RepID=M2X488_9PSEU|nr:transposase tn3 family protein [Amycolatopsis decaplanina DSM 44594]